MCDGTQQLCVTLSSKALHRAGFQGIVAIIPHDTGHLQDMTRQRVTSRRETRQMERDVTGTVMATPKLSMVITPLQSTLQATPKISLQDIAHYSINTMVC
jgi:hypothetical protein